MSEENKEIAVTEEKVLTEEKKPFPYNQPRYANLFGLGEDVCIITYEALTNTFTFALNHKYFTRTAKHNLPFLMERLRSAELFSEEELKTIQYKVNVFKEELWNKGILN